MSISSWVLLAVLAAAAVAASVAFADIRGGYRRIASAGAVIAGPQGNIEFTQEGMGLPGPPVLVVHGSGGGYDQGELIARSVLGEGFRWIAPSRFGYLRSTFRDGATFEDQARAYAHLLDELEVDKVAVLALSHGGPSALWFAVLYPERVSSLTLPVSPAISARWSIG